MPLAAFTMAILVFVYTRSSIHAAKRNAQKHREADGGQISWHNETRRRHGMLEPPEEQNSIKQLAGIAKDRRVEKGEVKSDTEQKIREVTGKGKSA
ncbi:hypothetical protein F5884DRAFT_850378 [Xylogone sp. PMI_703]|nr:hypothetical protein F5884DRAFT_850378 [Xylogone sp. PMI_703]